jgi:hypothetical protein
MSEGYTYCLIRADHFRRWPEVIPTPESTVNTMESALLTGRISHFAWLQTITTDQEHFHSLAKLCGIQLSQTISNCYHVRVTNVSLISGMWIKTATVHFKLKLSLILTCVTRVEGKEIRTVLLSNMV